jgi:hypothetical protein
MERRVYAKDAESNAITLASSTERALETCQKVGPNANADQLKVLSDMIAEGDYTNNPERMRELAVVHFSSILAGTLMPNSFSANRIKLLSC